MNSDLRVCTQYFHSQLHQGARSRVTRVDPDQSGEIFLKNKILIFHM
jgi:hypothetical protein